MSDTTSPAQGPSRTRIVAIAVILALILIAGIYALMDRSVPSSARGIVSAYVVQIAPRVSGTVTEVHVSDDAIVEAGDPLFSLDPRPFELAVAQAEANLASALQNVDASSASIVAAQAAVTQARTALDNTRTEAERTFKLEERGIVAAARGDQARTAVAEAEAALDGAEANLRSAQAQLGPEGEDNPAFQAAAAQLEQAQYDLASTTVRAQHLGAVTNLTLSEGQFIGAGSPALTFVDAEAGWITVDLRENQLQKVEAGDPAHVLFDALPGRIFNGRVQSIAWGIAPGRNVQGGLVVNQTAKTWFEPARSIPVRIELEGGMADWPYAARVGGKAHAVIFATSEHGPLALIARGLQRLRSWTSFLH
ncbi:HlyD family secretion protein [Roseovarius nanhaiticus]|uniref:HlyD family secretion protein n=1 Tax=Roseovarius nanhaiticus TaxID=573024 RepID=UPI0024928052|nr:HlyD family secretion protein [Roseovarius nanhaiticus]